MKLTDAFKRLRFTISNQNKPNQTDAEAFNEISKYFELHHKDIIQDNLLFAKLYAFVLAELLQHYTEIEFAQKQLNKISEDIDKGIYAEMHKHPVFQIDKPLLYFGWPVRRKQHIIPPPFFR